MASHEDVFAEVSSDMQEALDIFAAKPGEKINMATGRREETKPTSYGFSPTVIDVPNGPMLLFTKSKDKLPAPGTSVAALDRDQLENFESNDRMRIELWNPRVIDSDLGDEVEFSTWQEAIDARTKAEKIAQDADDNGEDLEENPDNLNLCVMYDPDGNDMTIEEFMELEFLWCPLDQINRLINNLSQS